MKNIQNLIIGICILIFVFMKEMPQNSTIIITVLAGINIGFAIGTNYTQTKK